MASGLYDECSNSVELGDTEGLLRCIVNRIEAKQKDVSYGINSQLLVLSGALVFFMQAGFAALCAGSVRKKNTQNTMLKNLLDACGAAVAFFTVGYAFSFGGDEAHRNGSGAESGTTFIGNDNFFGMGDIDLPFFFFQYTFAAASVTIVAGALAERCQMVAYLCYSFFLTGFIYPVVVHAIWSTHGFLSPTNSSPLLGIGVVDFSGSGVIHMTGGSTALIAVFLLGSRRGRFYDTRTGELLEVPKTFTGHSVSLQMLGSFILWFGWYGFNSGSALLLTDNIYQAEIGALCAVNTFLASAGGCIASLIGKFAISKARNGQAYFDLLSGMNGALAGLVSITAGCATLEPWSALVSGAIAGLLYLVGSHGLVKCRLDDVVDAIPVHLFAGTWGMISVGLFSDPDRMLKAYGNGADAHPGFFYSLSQGHADARLLGCQVLGVLFIVGWAVITMLPFFLALNAMGWLRCESVEELVGLDVAYNGDNGQVKSNGSDTDSAVRDEYLEAYEEYKNVSCKKSHRQGGQQKQRNRSDTRSLGAGTAADDSAEDAV